MAANGSHPYVDPFWAFDAQAMGDDAGPTPEATDAMWMWFCARCKMPVAQGYSWCPECLEDMWAHAESFTSETRAKDAIVTRLMREFRS